jgi:ADP-dependent NAD(P)H-hydrate dehydratase / NAD(P)H-hydrate epimerase
MKILSAEQIKQADRYTIEKEPVTSLDLMERASGAFVNWFEQRYSSEKNVQIFCGTGNNGGDGLAIARILRAKKYNIGVYILGEKEKGSADFKENLARLPSDVIPIFPSSANEIDLSSCLVIDALLGSGLNRPVEGLTGEIIHKINTAGKTIVSVDIPSGIFVDKPSTGDFIVRATETVSFQLPKLAFMAPENYKYTGEFHIVDIGLSQDFIAGCQTSCYYLTEEIITQKIRIRGKFSHKGDFGHTLIYAGSKGMMGAAVFASKAALKTGSGLVSVLLPESEGFLIQLSIPEAMVVHREEFANLDTGKYNVLATGPGLGKSIDTKYLLKKLLEQFKGPVVIDADAINLLASSDDLIKLIPPGSIVTPHLKEFERLAGPVLDHFERIKLLVQFSRTRKVITVLKGAHTAIAFPDGRIYFNSTGNPGMATGGSGDVLTGIIAGLLAQGYSTEDAVLTGVFLHGYAGDVAAEKYSEPSLLASDIISNIPAFFKRFYKNH